MSYERSSKPNHNVGNAETGYASKITLRNNRARIIERSWED